MANPRPTLKPQLARHVSSVEILAFRTGIFLQPWLCLAMLAENVLDIHRMHMTFASTIITSVISGAIVYFLLALLGRRFPRAAWILVAVLGLLAGLNTHTFIGDMKAIAKMEAIGYG